MNADRLRRKKIFLAIILAQLPFASISYAQDDEPTYCDEDEDSSPNGRVFKIGPRYFRVCNGSHSSLYSYFRPGASLTRILPPDIPIYNWNGLGILDQPRYGMQPIELATSVGRQEVARMQLGGAEYTIFATPIDNLDAAKTGRMPDYFIAYFPGSDALDLPEHIMSCSGQPFVDIREQYSCKVYFRYRPDEDIFVRETLAWNPEWVRPEGVFAQTPFNFENLPNQIRALMHIAQKIDVTDSIEELREQVSIIE